MTPLRARLFLFAIMALFLATAGNALFLQERPAALRDGLPRTAVSIAGDSLQAGSSGSPDGKAAAPLTAAAKAKVLQTALQRELSQRGYAAQLGFQNGLRLAVLAYEFDNGMPLTGEPSEIILKQILFDPNKAPRGLFADRAEVNKRLVMETQKILLGLGFFRGVLSGRMDVWTQGAVKDFETHRGLPATGRLSEATLLELISYSGQALQLSSG